MTIEVTVTPAHEEFAARLGAAGTGSDAAAVDAILDEIADAGLACAMATLAGQTRNLVVTLMAQHGEDATRALFETTALQAGAAVDD